MKTRLNILYMHCAPHVLTCMLLLFFYSLKAFETLVREIIKNRHLTGANVETTHQVHTSVSAHAHGFSMYMYWKMNHSETQLFQI